MTVKSTCIGTYFSLCVIPLFNVKPLYYGTRIGNVFIFYPFK